MAVRRGDEVDRVTFSLAALALHEKKTQTCVTNTPVVTKLQPERTYLQKLSLGGKVKECEELYFGSANLRRGKVLLNYLSQCLVLHLPDSRTLDICLKVDDFNTIYGYLKLLIELSSVSKG